MRSIALAVIILFHCSCKKDSNNELPLEEVHGKILYTTGLDLVELDIQSGQSKVIAPKSASLPAWSPDGSLLLWSDKINSGGAAVDKITDAQGNLVFEFDNPDVHDACWSPDGEEVAFFNIEKKIVTRINLATLVGDSFKLTLPVLYVQSGYPDWSADGKTFVFNARYLDNNANFTVWRVSVDGSDLEQLTPADGESSAYPKWSPDGQSIAYSTPTAIRLMSAEGTQNKTIIGDGATPHWSADGKLMMYSLRKDPGVGSTGYEIRARNLETGQERIIRENATLLDWHSLD